MKKIEKQNYESIDGGGFISGTLAVAGIVQSAVATGKMLFSDSGSIKTNDGLNFSWKDEGSDGVNILLPKMYDA